MNCCKAIFQVTAGVIPEIGIGELTKRWDYTTDDYEQDKRTSQDHETIFTKRLKEAHLYAMTITNPAEVNWVRVDWLWV